MGEPSTRMDAGVDRGMVARILAYLFGLGGLLLLATLLLPDSEQRQTAELCAVAGTAIVIAIGLIVGYDRLPVAFLRFAPVPGHRAGRVWSSTSPTPSTRPRTRMYLAWVLVAAALFLEERLILIHGVLAIVVYTTALLARDPSGTEVAVKIAMTIGTVVATTLVMSGHRAARPGRDEPARGGGAHGSADRPPEPARARRRVHAASSREPGARARRSVVLILDLDGFKRFNDEHGHLEGDGALQRVGLVLGEKTRAVDHAARIGGEEFAMLVTDCDTAAALALAERLRRAVEVEFGGDGGLTASCGVASHPAHGASPAELMAAADGALYEAKRRGRNRVVAASSGPRSALRVVPADG